MKNKSAITIITICIIAAVFFAVYVYNNKTAEESSYTVTEDEEKFIFTNENGEKTELEGTDYMASLDQSRFIVINEGKLSYFANNKTTELAEDVSSCTISNNGKVVAYIVPNFKEKLYEGTLFVYNGDTQKTTEVCHTAFVGSLSTVQVSPSGDTVAYAKNYNSENLTYDCCYYYNNKETVIGQNRNIVAVSDKAKYVYYNIENPESEARYSAIFAVLTSKNGEVVLDEAAYSNRMYLNLDYSQCVFYKGKDSDELYISRQGSQSELYAENDDNFDVSSLVAHTNPVLNVKNFE